MQKMNENDIMSANAIKIKENKIRLPEFLAEFWLKMFGCGRK